MFDIYSHTSLERLNVASSELSYETILHHWCHEAPCQHLSLSDSFSLSLLSVSCFNLSDMFSAWRFAKYLLLFLMLYHVLTPV